MGTLAVHRLDRDTSGLIVMARDPETHRRLSKLFADRQVEKEYLALVAGWPVDDQGTIDLPLIKDWPNRPKQKVDHELGLPSLTDWVCLAREQYVPNWRTEFACARFLLLPHTGRSHQLRVHLQQIGHAILGDDLYADEAARNAAPRLCLHASQLSFVHPWSNEKLIFRSDCPF